MIINAIALNAIAANTIAVNAIAINAIAVYTTAINAIAVYITDVNAIAIDFITTKLLLLLYGIKIRQISYKTAYQFLNFS